VPETCNDIGEVNVPDADCECGASPGDSCMMQEMPEGCANGCPVDMICLNDECVPKTELTSCEGRCCAGQDNSCIPDGAACYCDDFCVQVGDCCADFTAACGG
jgi:hypothetical protein